MWVNALNPPAYLSAGPSSSSRGADRGAASLPPTQALMYRAQKRGPSFCLEDTQDKRHNNNLLRRRDEWLGPGGRGFELAGGPGPTPGRGLQEASRGPRSGEGGPMQQV
ncbi:unnamed protein product [Arctogadus glacialis]